MAEGDSFDDMWQKYMDEYDRTVDKEAYLKQLNREIQKRIKAAQKAKND